MYNSKRVSATLHSGSGNFPVNLQIHCRPQWVQLIMCGEEGSGPVKGKMTATQPPEATQAVSNLLGFARSTLFQKVFESLIPG